MKRYNLKYRTLFQKSSNCLYYFIIAVIWQLQVIGWHYSFSNARVTFTAFEISSLNNLLQFSYFTQVMFPLQRAHLSFSAFNLEESNLCRYDHLVLYDGYDNTADVLGRYCGVQTPGDITASGNVIYIEFFFNL